LKIKLVPAIIKNIKNNLEFCKNSSIFVFTLAKSKYFKLCLIKNIKTMELELFLKNVSLENEE